MQNKKQNFLEEITKIKKEEFSKTSIKDRNKSLFSNNTSSKDSKSFSFLNIFNKDKMTFIAEIKFASPTNSDLGSSDQLLQRVEEYEKVGANAISIITERYFFKGDIAYVSKIKENVSLPVLQKDFIIDVQQIYEAKKVGSDALLLIARLVDIDRLKEFVSLCFSLGIEPIIEIATEEDLKKAVATKTNIIAVNARDLETFIVDVEKACLLMKKIPKRFIKLGFSGIHSVQEVSKYKKAGAKGVLVGTSLMKAKNIKSFIESLTL